MARSVSLREFEEVSDKLDRANTRAKNLKARADDAVMGVVETAEIGSAAFTIGMLDGRYGGVEILGVPLSLGSAIGLHLTALAGVAPDHLHAFGNGALAAYLNTLGSGVGAKMAQDAHAKISAAAAGGY